jgi:hypothetical protein
VDVHALSPTLESDVDEERSIPHAMPHH